MVNGKADFFIHIGVSHKVFGFGCDFLIRISFREVKTVLSRILANTRRIYNILL